MTSCQMYIFTQAPSAKQQIYIYLLYCTKAQCSGGKMACKMAIC